jgi:predicted ATPase
MNAPKGFLELVAHLLLSKQQNIAKIENTPVISDVIEFIANLFIKLTSNVQLVIIVLDSIQWLDAMSWDVVQKIFEIGKNVLIVGSSRPLEVTRLPMNELFWKDLNQKYRNDKRFYEARLGPLKEEEVKEMAAITFHCHSEELDDDFISDIYSHCNGMPYFVAEVLDGMVRTQACKRMPNGKMSCTKKDALVRFVFDSYFTQLKHSSKQSFCLLHVITEMSLFCQYR